MARRYGVSLEHGRKVAVLATTLLTASSRCIGSPPHTGKLLEAAAYLHDMGHCDQRTRHHKHSYYVVANSDMAGFTDRERVIIATICRYHRKSTARLRCIPSSPGAPAPEEKRVLLLLVPPAAARRCAGPQPRSAAEERHLSTARW